MTREYDASRRRRAAQVSGEAALRAFVETGSWSEAAHRLGVSVTVARRRVADYCAARGFVTVVQAAYWLGRPELESHFRQS